MKAIELMKAVAGEAFDTPGTVDNFKYGDKEREVSRVAVCLTATPDVIREASKWGADLIITHEPTYYEHTDEPFASPITDLKKRLIEECDVPICRFHDHMHFGRDDMIALGFIESMEWEDKGDFDGVSAFVLKEKTDPLTLAKDIEKKLGIKHVRIVGSADGEVEKIGLFLGHRGGDWWGEFKRCERFDLVIAGEWCEWHDGEIIRDASQLGVQMTALMLGHAASERDGMKYLAKVIKRDFEDRGVTAAYFECGELFSYAD